MRGRAERKPAVNPPKSEAKVNWSQVWHSAGFIVLEIRFGLYLWPMRSTVIQNDKFLMRCQVSFIGIFIFCKLKIKCNFSLQRKIQESWDVRKGQSWQWFSVGHQRWSTRETFPICILQSTPQKSVEVKCDMLKYLTQNGWLWSKKGPQKPTGEPNDFHQIRKKPTY